MIKNYLFMAFHQDGCSCGGCGDCDQDDAGLLEVVFEDSEMVEIQDEDGQTYEFYIVDEFDYEGQDYCVMMTKEDPFEFLIAKVEDEEDGESYLVTLEEDEEDAVYAYYDQLLDETPDDDEAAESDLED